MGVIRNAHRIVIETLNGKQHCEPGRRWGVVLKRILKGTCDVRTGLNWPSIESNGRTIAQAVSRSTLPRRPGFAPGSVHVGFAVDKAALRQVLLRHLRFSPVSVISPRLSTLIYHLGDEQQTRRPQFRDQCHPVDMNIIRSNYTTLHTQ
jgi:hypothetical protein